MAEKKATITFDREKETKNAVRFAERAEEGKPPIVGTLYAQKWFVGSAATVTVTLVVN